MPISTVSDSVNTATTYHSVPHRLYSVPFSWRSLTTAIPSLLASNFSVSFHSELCRPSSSHLIEILSYFRVCRIYAPLASWSSWTGPCWPDPPWHIIYETWDLDVPGFQISAKENRALSCTSLYFWNSLPVTIRIISFMSPKLHSIRLLKHTF